MQHSNKIKTVVLAILMLSIGSNNSFANPVEELNKIVMRSFQKDFSHAREVSWEVSDELYTATFKVNDQVMTAYYEASGNLLALTRNIPSTQLPLILLKGLKKKYGNYWITNLYELSARNDSNYYITIEDADQKIVLSSRGTSGWKVFKKEEK